MQESGALESLLIGVLQFFGTLVDAMPSLDFAWSSNIVSSIQVLLGLIGKANFLIPVSDIVLILGAVSAYRIAMFTIFIANWIIRRIADIIP
jgi:hypothetical protein